MEGILIIDKPKGMTSFRLVSFLRKRTGVKKIGHAGTLDPLATGLMILLVGRNFTRLSDSFLGAKKEYETTIKLGSSTTTYDAEGEIVDQSDHVPTLSQIEAVIETFQGLQNQIPPMFSAKKVDGKKLYELARKGKEIEREPQQVEMHLTLVDYSYPYLKVHVRCSKGTYIRTLGHDLGAKLGCFAHLSDLRRTRSGTFSLEQAFSLEELEEGPLPFLQHG
jgi:tRNA pseudouridine55 synthase